MNKKLKKSISLGLLSVSILSMSLCIDADSAYAASSQNRQQIAVKDVYNPTAFTEKIKKILAEYDSKTGINRMNDNKDTATAENSIDKYQEKEAAPPHSAPTEQKLAQHNFKNEGRYNFDWQGTPIAQSLYAVAKVANRDIVINGTLTGNVYMSLHNTTCENAMQYLSNAFDFNWMVDDNTIVISTSSLMMQSKVLNVHYLSDLEKLASDLKSLGLDESNIFANTETRTISVTGTPYQIKQVERRLAAIDKPVSQCLVLAQLIEINHGDSLDLGVQYSLPTYSHTGTPSGKTDDMSFKGNWLEKLTFSTSISANKSLSKGKVVSRPMIMVMNGQEGEVNFGDQVPILTSNTTAAATSITFEYKNVGTNLVITPAIDEITGTISMKIKAEISNITSWVSSGQNKAPQISTRKATTSAQLKSGQSFVIGGLMSVKDLDNLSGIPGLMNLPILGELFKFHTKSREYAEIYIMITPYIVGDNIDPKALLRKVDENNG